MHKTASKVWEYYGSNSSCHTRKAKSEGEKTYKEKRQANAWRTQRRWLVVLGCFKCTRLGDQWRHCVLQTCFLLRPRPSDSSNDEYITHHAHVLINIITWRKSGTIWFSISHDWTLLPFTRSWYRAFWKSLKKYILRVLHHAHALFVEPLLGAHISETVVANAIKSKLL